MRKQLVAVVVVAICFAAVVSANASGADAEDEGVVAAQRVKADRCGAKGGHCEVESTCGGRKLPGLCDSNGSGVDSVCCVPKRLSKGKKRLSPKQMAAKRKAAAQLRKKQSKKAKAAAAAMSKLGAKSKALAKDMPAKKPTKPGTAGDGKSFDFAMKDKPSSSVTPDGPKPAVAGAKKHKKHHKKGGKGKGKGKGKKSEEIEEIEKVEALQTRNEGQERQSRY